jgi:hypothetical protein
MTLCSREDSKGVLATLGSSLQSSWGRSDAFLGWFRFLPVSAVSGQGVRDKLQTVQIAGMEEREFCGDCIEARKPILVVGYQHMGS